MLEWATLLARVIKIWTVSTGESIQGVRLSSGVFSDTENGMYSKKLRNSKSVNFFIYTHRD
jgi:hypothetical protein